jgi:hypothetical protein
MARPCTPVFPRYDGFDTDCEFNLAYFSLSDPRRVAAYVRYHVHSPDDESAIFRFLWFLHCIGLSFYGTEIECDPAPLFRFALRDFGALGSALLSFREPFHTDDERFSQLEHFFRLFCKCRPLFAAIQPTIVRFLNNASSLQLFRKCGIEALNLVRIHFDRISRNNDKEIRLFFTLPSSYIAPK